jgi:hypothetical protein
MRATAAAAEDTEEEEAEKDFRLTGGETFTAGDAEAKLEGLLSRFGPLPALVSKQERALCTIMSLELKRD